MAPRKIQLSCGLSGSTQVNKIFLVLNIRMILISVDGDKRIPIQLTNVSKMPIRPD